MCLFSMRINLGWLFLTNRRLRKFFLLPPHNCLKNLDKRPDLGIELSTEIPAENMGYRCDGENSGEPRGQSPFCLPLSLNGWANIRFPNICFSISMWVAFLPFEVSNHSGQHPLLSLAEDGVSAENFGHLGKLLSFLGLSHVYVSLRFCLIFLLWICLMSI